MKRKEYIVYDTTTDFPVCLGNIVECSLALGVTPSTLKSTSTRYFRGERSNCRYILYDLDKLIAGGYLEEGDNCEQLCED